MDKKKEPIYISDLVHQLVYETELSNYINDLLDKGIRVNQDTIIEKYKEIKYHKEKKL